MRTKFLAMLTALCLVATMAMPVFAEETEEIVENMTEIYVTVGDNSLSVEDATAVNIFLFTAEDESQVGVYKVTTDSADARLRVYGGSSAFWYDRTDSSDYDETTNSFTFEVENVGPSYLIGVTGASEFVLTLEYLGASDAPVDPGTIPYVEYVGNTTPQEFTLDIADTQYLTYVDVTDKNVVNSAVLGDDGYYHLNSADGPVLYANLGSSDYFAFPSAAELGALRAYIYDDNGEFVTKYDFTTMYYAYYECVDSKYSVYPLTEDLIYMLKTVGEFKGWYSYEDKNSGGAYLFGDTVQVNEESAWLFCCCYVDGSIASEQTLTLNGEATVYLSGEEVAINAEFYVDGGVAYRFSKWTGDVEAAGIDAAAASQTFVMPGEDIALTAEYIAVGDIIVDGMITGKDLNAIKRMVVNLMTAENCADINNDGQVNAGDTNLLMRYMLSLWTPTK